MKYYENGDYEEAVHAFGYAASWGYGQKAVRKLADSYYQLGEYKEAAHYYEQYLKKRDEKEIRNDLVDTYSLLADQAVSEGDFETAQEALKKSYAIYEDEATQLRLKACIDEVSYTSQQGTTYDPYGNVLSTVVKDDNGEELYRLTLTYDENEKLSAMVATTPDGATTTFKKFDPDMDYEISWSINKKGNLIYRADGSKEGQRMIHALNSTHTYTYENTYDDNDLLVSSVESCKELRTSNTYTYTYDETGLVKKIDIDTKDGKIVESYEYDKQGRLTGLVSMRNKVQLIRKIENVYEDDGSVSYSTEIYNVQDDKTENIAFPGYKKIVYEYTSTGQPWTSSIYDKNDELVGHGQYIRGVGWLQLYLSEAED